MDEPLTIWGIPVVEDDTLPANESRLVVGRVVTRQDGAAEWDGVRHWVVRSIGEPYEAVVPHEDADG